MSSEGNKDPQGDLSSKGIDTPEGKKSKEETQMQDACTLRPTHLTRHGDHSNEKYPTKAAVTKSSQNVLCGAVSGEDTTHSSATAVPENSKEAPSVDLSKINVSKENNDSGLSVSSQSRNTVAVNPYISRGLVGHSDSPSDQNEVVEESASLNEGSHGTQCLRGTSMNLPKKASFGTKNVEEGTSGLKNLSSLMQRENRNAKPELLNETGSFSLLSKSANVKASRPPELNPDITLNQLNSANIKKRNAHPIDLKREQKCARPEKSEIALEKTYCKPALHVPLTTSMNAKLDIEPLSTGNCNLSVPNAPSSTGHGIFPGQALLKSSIASDNIQDTPSKDIKIPAISQLTGTTRIAKVGGRNPKSGLLPEKESEEVNGRKCAPVTKSKIPNSFLEQKSALLSPSVKQKMPEESVPDLKAPAVLKRIIRSPLSRQSPKTMPELGNQTILGSGTPKARMDNKVISSAMPYDMGDISDLELPSLLENDGNVEKAEACRKQLEDICILLKRKHGEAKELAVRAVVMNNMMLMLNHPMIEEKICALQKFTNSLKSKIYLFEEISTIDAH